METSGGGADTNTGIGTSTEVVHGVSTGRAGGGGGGGRETTGLAVEQSVDQEPPPLPPPAPPHPPAGHPPEGYTLVGIGGRAGRE